MQKRATFISKNIELLQEFHFSHPKSLVKINNIYNSSYYGCVLWNYESNEVKRFDKSWNVAMRKIFRLPYQSHRCFLEPLSQSNHAIFSFYKRFIKFTDSLKLSSKSLLKNLFNIVKNDCRSKTGSNLRNLMILTGKTKVENLCVGNISKLKYVNLPADDEWKIAIMNEITDLRYGLLEVPHFKKSELQEILCYVCTS